MSLQILSKIFNYPKLSSPQSDNLPASIKLPKNFQPVGTSNISLFSFSATLKHFYINSNLLASNTHNGWWWYIQGGENVIKHHGDFVKQSTVSRSEKDAHCLDEFTV